MRPILALNWNRASRFDDSRSYWRRRYERGGDSGRGSYGEYAAGKARFLNTFVADHGIESVIEFGCGDGNQLSLADYPRYLGLDVSEAAVARCKERFSDDGSKEFLLIDSYEGQRADLSLSLDVIYHLVEDEVFDAHMRLVFSAANRFVIVYSTNTDERGMRDKAHVRHRYFTRWIEANATGWELVGVVPSTATLRPAVDFYVFARRAAPTDLVSASG